MLSEHKSNAWREKIMRDLIALNKLRESAYIRIKHVIDSCTNYAQLQQCNSMVDAFCDKGGGDAADLRKYYGLRLMALNPEKKYISAANDEYIPRLNKE